MKKVVIVQFQYPHYRSKFYEKLRTEMLDSGVDLQIVCAEGHNIASVRGVSDHVKLVKAKKVKNFVYLPVLKILKGADLVILQSEFKFIQNYFIYIWSWVLRGPKIAFWGHGRNFQNLNDDSRSEKVRKWISKKAHWWFAYNELCLKIVEGFGFPKERITDVRNSIDMNLIRQNIAAVNDVAVEELRLNLGIDSENVAVYTGRYIGYKRMGYLLECCVLIREKLPDFHMIFIGSGPEGEAVESYAEKFPWIHSVGPKNDIEKIPYWKLSKVLLMPGAMGLVVLDSFVFGVPMITTDLPNHGPEIDYITASENAIIVEDSESKERYASTVANLLSDKSELARLSQNCLNEGEKYSSEIMASRFAAGIKEALKS